MNQRLLRRALSCCSVVLALLLTPGCGSQSTEPSGISANTLVGTWAVYLTSRPDCAGFSGAWDLRLFVTGTSPGSGNAVNIIDQWTNSPTSSYRWVLIGNVDLSTRHVSFHLWHDALVSGGLLEGTIDAAGHFTGTFTDPIPGYSPVFVLGSCVFPATGDVQ